MSKISKMKIPYTKLFRVDGEGAGFEMEFSSGNCDRIFDCFKKYSEMPSTKFFRVGVDGEIQL